MTKIKETKATGYLAGFILAVSLLFAGTIATTLPAQEKPVKLSHQRLNDLIKSAKEPADHMKLAAYYRQEAARLREEAKDHQEAAQVYGVSGRTKPTIANGAPHCETWAKLDLDAAKEADGLATMHENMAKAGDKQ